MKKKILILLPAFALIICSCKQEKEKPKVTYKNTTTTVETAVDSAQIEIADLPVQIPGTDFLLHPIGQYRVYDGSRKTGYTYERGSFNVSNYGEFEITGFLNNIKVQRVDSDSLNVIFDKPVIIQTATYLKTFADKSKEHLMAFTVSDMDTNQDGKLDASDIKTLYLGAMDGSRITKVSPDYQELIDWNYIDRTNRLYFRTIEDTNKSGEFDKNDVLHYHYINLSEKDWKPVEYKPV
ncbi:hypothetical protein [Flavobacterium silvaticum]|uniref:EF-hand domain-containing protein n=1 Tax=Flavobacterium silvaticum TaxID=1852020 RepID=A0A972FMR9_9FLAO|nr:hypothetical protein [Flavobacterium silvaticum]NMH28090.1 hypothetical protein [Flavobacterium silvaticum]